MAQTSFIISGHADYDTGLYSFFESLGWKTSELTTSLRMTGAFFQTTEFWKDINLLDQRVEGLKTIHTEMLKEIKKAGHGTSSVPNFIGVTETNDITNIYSSTKALKETAIQILEKLTKKEASGVKLPLSGISAKLKAIEVISITSKLEHSAKGVLDVREKILEGLKSNPTSPMFTTLVGNEKNKSKHFSTRGTILPSLMIGGSKSFGAAGVMGEGRVFISPVTFAGGLITTSSPGNTLVHEMIHAFHRNINYFFNDPGLKTELDKILRVASSQTRTAFIKAKAQEWGYTVGDYLNSQQFRGYMGQNGRVVPGDKQFLDNYFTKQEEVLAREGATWISGGKTSVPAAQQAFEMMEKLGIISQEDKKLLKSLFVTYNKSFKSSIRELKKLDVLTGGLVQTQLEKESVISSDNKIIKSMMASGKQAESNVEDLNWNLIDKYTSAKLEKQLVKKGYPLPKPKIAGQPLTRKDFENPEYLRKMSRLGFPIRVDEKDAYEKFSKLIQSGSVTGLDAGTSSKYFNNTTDPYFVNRFSTSSGKYALSQTEFWDLIGLSKRNIDEIIKTKSPSEQAKFRKLLDFAYSRVGKSLYDAFSTGGVINGVLTSESISHAMQRPIQIPGHHNPKYVRDLLLALGNEKGTKVLDMSAGWGDRLLAALVSNNVSEYVGVDPSNVNNLKGKGYDAVIKAFNIRGIDAKVFKDIAEDFDIKKYPQFRKYFDVSFTSPPYYGKTEDYQTVKSGSIIKEYGSSVSWIENFLRPNFKNQREMLKDTGIIGWNVAQFTNMDKGESTKLLEWLTSGIKNAPEGSSLFRNLEEALLFLQKNPAKFPLELVSKIVAEQEGLSLVGMQKLNLGRRLGGTKGNKYEPILFFQKRGYANTLDWKDLVRQAELRGKLQLLNSIPKYAKGGYKNGGIYIAGESGTEFVLSPQETHALEYAIHGPGRGKLSEGEILQWLSKVSGGSPYSGKSPLVPQAEARAKSWANAYAVTTTGVGAPAVSPTTVSTPTTPVLSTGGGTIKPPPGAFAPPTGKSLAGGTQSTKTTPAQQATQNESILNNYSSLANRLLTTIKDDTGKLFTDVASLAKKPGLVVSKMAQDLNKQLETVKVGGAGLKSSEFVVGGQNMVPGRQARTVNETVGYNKDYESAQKMDLARGQDLQNVLKSNQRTYAGLQQTAPNALREVQARFPDILTNPQGKLTSSSQMTSTGRTITTVNASMKDMDGITQKISVSQNDLGQVIGANSKKFSSFGDQIKRDTGEFIKWQIGMMLVTGSVTAVTMAISKMINIQAALANITLTLGKTQITTNEIFQNAAKIAVQTGESIEGVIDGYNLAFRATGNIKNETERLATANKLLTDSIVLSKLSSLDQATATDVLTSALRQNGMALDQGSMLIDKWVKVSRIANVDVATLAMGFAVVGEAAAQAGLGVDELNGVIATMAEANPTSAKETANAVRMIVSGYTNPGAQKALGRQGIATQDINGNQIGMLSVFGSVAAGLDEGTISSRQFQQISKGVGGSGGRGAARAAGMMINSMRINQISQESANTPAGEAQTALNVQLGTLQTHITQLSNSFVKLATVVGSEGGLLGTIDKLAIGLAKIVDVLAIVAGAVGTSAIGPSAFMIGSKFGKFDQMAERVGAQRYGDLAPGQQGRGFINGLQQAIPGMSVGGNATTKEFISKYGKMIDAERLAQQGNGFNALGASNKELGKMSERSFNDALSAGGGLKEEYDKMKMAQREIVATSWKQNIPVIAASISAAMGIAMDAASGNTFGAVGGAIGGLIGGIISVITMNPLPLLLGQSVGSGLGGLGDKAVGKKMTAFDKAEEDRKRMEFNGTPTAGLSEAEKKANAMKLLSPSDIIALYAAGGPDNAKTAEDLPKLISSARSKAGITKTIQAVGLSGKPQQSIDDILQEQALAMANGGGAAKGFGIKTPFGQINPFGTTKAGGFGLQDVLNAISANKAEDEQGLFGKTSATKNIVSKYTNLSQIDAQKTKESGEIKEMLKSGQISVSDYNARAEAVSGLGSSVPRILAALGDSAKNLPDAFNMITQVLVDGSDVNATALTQLATGILTLDEEIAKAKLNPGSYVNYGDIPELTVEEASKMVAGYREQLDLSLPESYKATQAENVKLPSIMGLGDVSKKYGDAIQKMATELQNTQYNQIKEESGVEIADAFIEEWKKEDIIGKFADGVQKFDDVSGEFVSDAIQKLIEQNKIKEATPIGIETMDQETLDNVRAQYPAFEKVFKNFYTGTLGKTEAQYTKDYPVETKAIWNETTKRWDKLDGNFNLIGMLLQEANKLAEKQLDGMYNLPDGAGFYVPLQAAAMRPTPEGTGDMSEVTTAVDKSKDAIVVAVNGVKTAIIDGGNRFFAPPTVSEPKIPVWDEANIAPGYPGFKFSKTDIPIWDQANISPGYSFGGPKIPTYDYKQIEDTQMDIPGMHNDYLFLDDVLNAQTNKNKSYEVKPYGIGAGQAPAMPNILDWIKQLFTPSTQPTGGFGTGIGNSMFGQNTIQKMNSIGASAASGATAVGSTVVPTMKFSLQINSDIRLMVDGRQMANVVKAYMAEDMIKATGTGGSSTINRVIIA